MYKYFDENYSKNYYIIKDSHAFVVCCKLELFSAHIDGAKSHSSEVPKQNLLSVK